MDTQLERLLRRISASSEDASVSQLIDSNSNIRRRTPQRRLRQLVEDGRIVALGEGRSRRYRAISTRAGSEDSANLPQIRANLCPLTFLGVPEKAYGAATLGIYEMTRIELLRDL